MTEGTLLQQYVHIGLVVAAYWFISITLGELSLLILSSISLINEMLIIETYF